MRSSIYPPGLFEKRGVLNRYVADYNGTNQQHINTIYNWIRKKIIAECNKGKLSISFIVPATVYNESKQLTNISKLTIKYFGNQGNSIKMNTESSTPSEITLSIFIDLFDSEFKSIFFHEFHHIFQMTKRPKTSEIPIPDVINSFFFNNSLSLQEKTKLNELNELIYYYNPLEINAFKEQIYKEAFNYTCTHYKEDKNKIYKTLYNNFLNQYKFNSNILNEINNQNKLILIYIWCQIFLNYNYNLNKENPEYPLFSSLVYQDKGISYLINYIQKIRLTNNSYNFYILLVNNFDIFLGNSKLIETTISSFKHSIIFKYKNKFIEKMKQSMDIAIEDALNSNKVEMIYDFVRIDGNTMFIEVIINEGNNNYITALNGFFFKDIFKIKMFLDLYLRNSQYSSIFGFQEIENMYQDYLQKSPFYQTQIKKQNNKISKIKNWVTIENIINYISLNI